MSIIFVFTRISPADADRLTGAPDIADEFLDALPLADDEPCGDLDQAWDGLRLLFPAAAVDFDLLREDRSGGRQDCLSVWTPKEVAAAAKILTSTPFGTLAERFSPELMDEEAARPEIWDDRDEALDYLGDGYARLRAFFAYAFSTDSAAIGRFA